MHRILEKENMALKFCSPLFYALRNCRIVLDNFRQRWIQLIINSTVVYTLQKGLENSDVHLDPNLYQLVKTLVCTSLELEVWLVSSKQVKQYLVPKTASLNSSKRSARSSLP